MQESFESCTKPLSSSISSSTQPIKIDIRNLPVENMEFSSPVMNSHIVNVAPLSRKKSSYVDIEKARKELVEKMSFFK